MPEGLSSTPESEHSKISSEILPKTTFHSSPHTETDGERQGLDLIRQEYQAIWTPLEPNVMKAFREVTNNNWKPNIIENGIKTTFTGRKSSEWNSNAEVDLRCTEKITKTGPLSPWKSTYEIMGSHIHELGHGIQSSDDRRYMRKHIGPLVPSELLEKFTVQYSDPDHTRNRFLKEVYADLVSLVVAEKIFSADQVREWREHRKIKYGGAPSEFIEMLTEEQKKENEALYQLS